MVADITLEFTGNELVDLSDQDGDLWDKLNEALRHENDTVVFAPSGSVNDNVSHVVGDLDQGLVLCLDLFADEDAVDAGPQGTLEGNVRGRPTHESDEVVVLFGGNDVGAKVADSLRVHFGRSVETKRDWDVLVFQVAINCLGTSNDLALGLLLGEVLSQEAGIGVRVVATDHNKSVKIELDSVFEGAGKLLRGLNLVTARTYKHLVNNLVEMGGEAHDWTALLV